MTDTPDDLLLLEAEHLARDLLLDIDRTRAASASLVEGWEPVLRAASACLTHDGNNPLGQVLEIWHGMRRDARDWVGPSRADPRMTRISELLDDVASQPCPPETWSQRRTTVLHTCYLATHAVISSLHEYAGVLSVEKATRSQGLLVAVLATRLQGAEQVLDAHLGISKSDTDGAGPTTELVTAITTWDQALHEALVDRIPDPRILLASANVALGLLRHTADLANRSLAHGGPDTFEVQNRVLPALEGAINSWQQDRHIWRSIAPTTSGIPPAMAAAAHDLHHAIDRNLRTTTADPRPVQRLAVAEAVEAAHLQVQAARRPDLTGTATGVADLTRTVLDQIPGARHLETWRQLERLDGPHLISIPSLVRADLLRQTTETLVANTTLASASHGLARTNPRTDRPTIQLERQNRHLRAVQARPVGRSR